MVLKSSKLICIETAPSKRTISNLINVLMESNPLLDIKEYKGEYFSLTEDGKKEVFSFNDKSKIVTIATSKDNYLKDIGRIFEVINMQTSKAIISINGGKSLSIMEGEEIFEELQRGLPDNAFLLWTMRIMPELGDKRKIICLLE